MSPVGRAGFSLIELVVVIVIIGVLMAIAVPRLSRGLGGTELPAYQQNLAALRKAIDYYHADHGSYPTADPLQGSRTSVMLQLTQYTDAAGNYAAAKSATHSYGPYLRTIPELTVSGRKSRTRIATADGSGVGWIYNPATGEIRGNTAAETDPAGRLYSDY